MFEELLAYLDAAGVRFVVVGGLAVVIHGHARLNPGIDLVVDFETENMRRAINALASAGLRPLLTVNASNFVDEETHRQCVEILTRPVFTMCDPGNPLLTVNLFPHEPIFFDDLCSRAETVVLGGQAIHVASLDAVAEPYARHAAATAEWNSDFRAAEEQALEASLAATPSQRLAWLEDALAFAWKVGALQRPDEELRVRNGVPLLPKGSQPSTMETVNRLRDET